MPRIPIGVLCRCSLRQLGDLRYATPTKTEFEAVAAVLHVVLTRVPGYCAHHDFVKVFFCGAYEYSAAQPQILRILSPGNEASWTKTTSHHSAPAGLAGPPPLLHPHPLFLPPQRSTAKTSRVLLPSPLCVDLVAARLVPRLVRVQSIAARTSFSPLLLGCSCFDFSLTITGSCGLCCRAEPSLPRLAHRAVPGVRRRTGRRTRTMRVAAGVQESTRAQRKKGHQRSRAGSWTTHTHTYIYTANT